MAWRGVHGAPTVSPAPEQGQLWESHSTATDLSSSVSLLPPASPLSWPPHAFLPALHLVFLRQVVRPAARPVLGDPTHGVKGGCRGSGL